jgi:hypothetical protein
MVAGLSLAFISAVTTARANVYATDIQINASLYSLTNSTSPASPATITYRLNQAASAGVTVSILQGNTQVATINGGAVMGLNTVLWGGTNNSGAAVGPGTYSVSIAAAAAGFPTWTQISIDTNAGMPAYYPRGIDVDKNITSPYYGRVIMGCALSDVGNYNPFVPSFARQDGLYKMNADGTYADEGGFGDAGYTEDDAGDTQTPGQMPDSSEFNPLTIRIGEDDRIYWCDDSGIGAILACDMRATTNQPVIVLDSGIYNGNPDFSDLGTSESGGVQQFDVTGTTTTHAAVWLADTADYPNWGIWMFHMTNGAVATNETIGTQAVQTSYDNTSSPQHPSDLLEASGGCSVDNNLDIFVSSGQPGAVMGILQTMLYPNWNGGVLPAVNSGESFTYGLANKQVSWGDQIASSSDYSWEAIQDTVINNRSNPTLVALPMAAGNNNGPGGGVKVVNAANGAVIVTNLDFGNAYTCAAWDNVGNLYAASTTTNCWRVWSPPGASANTTLAVAQLTIPSPLTITGITASPTSPPGCAIVNITFTFLGSPAPSAFHVIGSATVSGVYTTVAGAVITGGPGTYQATFTNCSTQFYQIEE